MRHAARALVVLGAVVVAAGCAAAAPPAGGDAACPPTRPTGLGPMYQADAPERQATGEGLVVSGTVRSAAGCAALPGARLEWWSADPGGRYDEAHRATQRADGAGRYRYETDVPGGYGLFRRPHLHVRVTAPGHRTLVTQLYPAAGQTAIQVDLVLAPE